MNLQQIEQMESALAESSKKPWSAFTDDSRDRPHTNIIGVVPHTHCVLSLSGHHKSEPNVTLATLAPDMAAHIIAQSEQIAALEKRVESADALPEIADDVIRASNTMMLMLSGDLSMTKPSLEAALRRALDARNGWDNGLSAYRAAREGKA